MVVPDTHPNFPEMERDRLKWWFQEQIVEKYLEQNENSDKRFRFLDGPITANNPMGVHHAHGRTIKDFFQRVKNMQGFKQRFQNGFDCQGLWVEVEEEKALGFNSKQDIEEYGIGNFCNACEVRVEKFSKVQEEQSKRLGMFMDWDNSYYTKSERNNLHIWHFLKKVDELGWLYQGFDAMPWCTRCGTAISQHELSDGGYKDVDHESIYVKYKVSDSSSINESKSLDSNKNVYFLIWTTTPWTLLANSAVAVNPDIEYVIAEQNDNYLILAKNRLSVIEDLGEYTVVTDITGQQLYGYFNEEEHIYEHPFGELDTPSTLATRRIVLWDEVSDEDGSGIVHIAPSAGKEDFELGKTFNLGYEASSIDEFGKYIGGFGDFSNKSVFSVRQEIYESLKSKDLFYKTENIHHTYPHCWRCKNELVFRTTSEWFIKSDEIRQKMKNASEDVNWLPEHAGKRMQDWLDNMGDWPISRKRYWGLSLPFFKSDDGQEYHVVGSLEELKELAIEPDKVDNLKDLHRPHIDEIKIKSPKTGKTLTRVTDVGDCWLDAGIVPFSTVDYLTDKENWEQWYPFEFITEYVPQVKLWFYATLFMSVALEGIAPWKNVLATGFLVDEKGNAMHKSAGNSIAFDEAADKAGSDSIRWLYLRERVGNHHGTGNLRFGYGILEEVRRRFFVIYWNSYRFVIQNALLDNWNPDNDYDESFRSENVLDVWIRSRLNSIIEKGNQSIEKFDSTEIALDLERFIVQEFSQWYIRRSRSRVGPNAKDDSAKKSFYNTAYYVLKTLSSYLAPFIPFLTEEMYQNLKLESDPESVHLTSWPKANTVDINESLEEQMKDVRSIVETVLSKRREAGIKVRQPLSTVTITLPHDLLPELQEIIKNEVNVKAIEIIHSTDEVENHGCILDLEITEELKNEGFLREITREFQQLRKQEKFALDDEVNIGITIDDEKLMNYIQYNVQQIKDQIIAHNAEWTNLETPDALKEVNIYGTIVCLTIQKV